jgi:hypothetical protein
VREALVSTEILRQKRQEARAELDAHRPYLTEQVTAYAEKILLQWEQAEREAARQFVPTARAAALTGWSPETLTDHARQIEAGASVPEEWRGLLAQRTSAGWSFVLSSVPVKRSKAA